MYIVFEGMPFSGKTTHSNLLVEHLNTNNIHSIYHKAIPSKFGKTLIKRFHNYANTLKGDLIHMADIFLDSAHLAYTLKNGTTIVSDRCPTSAMTYYKTFRNGIKQKVLLEMIAFIKHTGPKPDLLFLLDVCEDELKERMSNKKDVKSFEREIVVNKDLFYVCRNNLLESISEYSNNTILLKCDNQTIDEVQNKIRRVTYDRCRS